MASDTGKRGTPEIVAALVQVVIALENAGRGDLVPVLFLGLAHHFGAEQVAPLWDAVSFRAACLFPGVDEKEPTNVE